MHVLDISRARLAHMPVLAFKLSLGLSLRPPIGAAVRTPSLLGAELCLGRLFNVLATCQCSQQSCNTSSASKDWCAAM